MQNSSHPQSRRDSPFQGPRPFAEEDKGWFFGRDDETDQILSLILGHKVVLIYAQSGAGKSSLLNAKIIPELEENELYVFPVARVGGYLGLSTLGESYKRSDLIGNPFVNNAIQSIMGDVTRDKFDPLSVSSNVATLSDFLEKKIDEQLKERTGRKRPIVLIFDQLEELFRSSINSSYEMQQDFFNQISSALDNGYLSRVVLVIREDYLAHLDPFREIIPEKLRPFFRLEPLNTDEAKEAIQKPLEKSKEYFREYGISKRIDVVLKRQSNDSDSEVEELDQQNDSQSLSLVDKIVKSLCTMRFELPDGRTTEVVGRFVEPIYLQVVGQRLWENLKSASSSDINLDYFGDIGDVDKALQDFYEKAISEVVEKTGIYEGDVRIWLETRLITSSGTRGNVHRGRKWTSGIPNKVLDILDDQHVIRAEVHFGGKWYELTHDRLIRPLLNSNRVWKDNLQRMLKGESLLLRISDWLGKPTDSE